MEPPQHFMYIHAGHYATLAREDLNGFRSAIGQDANIPNLVCESDGSSLLHLAASVGHIRYINFIVLVSPTLLYQPNSNSDLPVHVASRNGELEAVRTLISHSAAQPRNNADDEISMLEAKNMDGNTALHIALENQQEEMAKCLVEKCPQTFYKLNAQEISPLYLAIQAQFWELAKYMLSTHIVNQCPDAPNHLNLPEAKSVIHAAITAKNKDIFGMISNQYTEVVRYKTDERGMTPISYAAYTGFLDGVKYIFSNNRLQNQAFKIDENGLFPIHWACMGGNVDVVKEFISHFSVRAMLLVSKKGHNILHVAAASGKTEVVKYILRQPGFEKMINTKDEDGNTPLHLATMEKHPKVVYIFTWDNRVKLTLQNKARLTALDIAEECGNGIPSFEERLAWLSLIYAGVPRAPQLHYVNSLHPPADMSTGSQTNEHPSVAVSDENTSTVSVVLDDQGNIVSFQQKKKKGNIVSTNHPKVKKKNKYKERINTLLLVSTLVATVTYASASNIPGGYNNNEPHVGMATLAHKAAFKVFVICNTISMYSAILAAVTLIWAHLDDLRLVLLSLDVALPLLGIALATMCVAFMAGFFVMLHNVANWLAVLVLVIGGVLLGVLMILFILLLSPRSCNGGNKILRYLFHVPFTLMLLASEKEKTGLY